MDIFALRDARRPNMIKERAQWNASWEKDLKKAYDNLPRQLPTLGTIIGVNVEPFSEETKQFTTRQIKETRATLIDNQVTTRNILLRCLVMEQFAEQWAALTADKRKDHVLDIIHKISMEGPESEYSRSWCPEMTTNNIGLNPRSLIDLMLVLGNGEDGKLTEFPHPLFDLLIATARRVEASHAIQEMSIHVSIAFSRTHYLSSFLFKICYIFSGRSRLGRTNPMIWKNEKKRMFKEAQSALPSNDMFKTVWRNNDGQGARNRCWGCGLNEQELPTGNKLLVCSGCKKIGRKILYCSRDCQKTDWSQGEDNFVPHKQVCGNPSREATETRPQTTELVPLVVKPCDMRELYAAIPRNDASIASDSKPRSDFKPSITLRYQRLRTEKVDVADYTLLIPPVELSIVVPGASLKEEFIRARTKAFENGDTASVKRMYEILKPIVAHCAPIEYNVADQLKAEYGLEFPEYRGMQNNMQQLVEEVERHKARLGFTS